MRDPAISWIWLLLAGVGAGLVGSVAGLASLVSYPSLLAVGLAPVAANMTNTVAIVFSSVGSVWGFRPELSELGHGVRRLAPLALAGGLCGAVVLLLTPAGYFSKAVPVLIGAASLTVLAPRRPAQAGETRRRRRSKLFGASIFLVAVYGGYFGAGAGVVLMAVLLAGSALSLTNCVVLRNLLVGLANAVAAVIFGIFGPVHWLAVLPLAMGFLAGGRLGPLVVRRVPEVHLRVLVACVGVGLAVYLAIGVY